jgi:hypothetical protein
MIVQKILDLAGCVSLSRYLNLKNNLDTNNLFALGLGCYSPVSPVVRLLIHSWRPETHPTTLIYSQGDDY